MPAKFFGEYLLERGVITREMLTEATALQPALTRPVCAAAVEKGLLSADQLAALDAERGMEEGKTLRIQVKDGKLSFEPRDKTFLDLSDQGLALAEALIEKGHLKLTDLQWLLRDYKKDVLEQDKQFWVYQQIREKILEGVPHKDLVSAFLQATVDTYIERTQRTVRFLDVKEDLDLRDEVDYVFSQQISGDRSFVFALGLPEDEVRVVASHLLGSEVREIDELALDAVSEVVNVAVGIGCRRLSAKNCKLHADSPHITTKTMMRRLVPPRALTVRMKTTSSMFYVMFFFEERERRSVLVWREGRAAPAHGTPRPVPPAGPPASERATPGSPARPGAAPRREVRREPTHR